MAEQLGMLTCGLCAEVGVEVSVVETRMVEWTDDAMRGMGRPRYEVVARCVDRAACRSRVELVLEVPWPVNDRTPAPVAGGGSPNDEPKTRGPLANLPFAETGSNLSPPIEPAPNNAPDAEPVNAGEEEISWLR